MIQQTSLFAYHNHITNGRLGEQQQKLLSAIRKYPNRTDAELSEPASLSRNVTPARRGELYKKGLIMCAGKRKQINGKLAMVWVAK